MDIKKIIIISILSLTSLFFANTNAQQNVTGLRQDSIQTSPNLPDKTLKAGSLSRDSIFGTSNTSTKTVNSRQGSVSKKSNSSTKTVHVKGYYRKDGTYVRPHTRRAPSKRK
jgi:hypothetical protein